MSAVGQHSDIDVLDSGGRHRSRPVLLATLSVRIDPNAERVAIEAALETGARLVIANMLWLPAFPATLMLAPQYATLPHEEDLEAVRAVGGSSSGTRSANGAVADLEPATAAPR